MTSQQIEDRILEAAGRRGVCASMEAGLLGISKKEAAAVIKKLVRQGKLYNTNTTRPNFWGGAQGNYRLTAVQSDIAAYADFMDQVI